ncbi:MAG: hypothetical protein K8S87_04000 [Planctomycetes bacterium]|nr:hypothetical protein [Planctomycetota bacterium]
MKKYTLFALILMGLMLASSGAADNRSYILKQNPNMLSDEIVQYLNEKYFPDGVPNSAVKFLKLSDADMLTVKSAPGHDIFRAKEGFLVKPTNIIVTTPKDGKIFLGYKNNHRIRESKIDENVEFTLTKLYMPDEIKLPEIPDGYKMAETFSTLLPDGTSKETKDILDSLLKNKKGQQLLKEFTLLKLNIPAEDLKFAIYVLENMAEAGFRNLNKEETATILHSDADFMPEGEFFNNVYYALKARKDLPWCKNMSDEIFKDYVLPHRCSEEQMFSWRARCYNALAPIVSKMKTLDEAKKYASSIYGMIVKYRKDVFFEDQGFLSLMLSHEGRCEEMTNFENRLLMSVGIPAMHVYTPAWARGDGNHAWSGYYKDNKLVGGQKRYTKAAKVYTRNGYGVRKDVTVEFGNVANFTLENLKPETDVFLNVWNHDMWVAVARYKTDEKGILQAKNIGANSNCWLSLSYSHHNYYNENKHEPIVDSFLVINEQIEFLKWDDAKKTTVKMVLKSGNLKKDAKYKILAYKNHEWIVVHEFTALEDKSAEIEFSTCKTILILADADDNRLGRPFMVDETSKINGF